MSSKKKVIAVAITTVALTIGSVGIGQAASKSKVVSTKITRTSVNGVSNPMAKAGGPAAAMDSVLSALVANGTITQTQADSIKSAITAAAGARGEDRFGKKMGPKGSMNADRQATEELIATTIGVDVATIRSRLAAGESLATIAGAKKADLISVLVAEATKRIDAAVTAGKLTAKQAVEKKASLTAHVTEEIEEVGGKGGPGKGGLGKGGFKLDALGAMDMFPQTAHVEAMALFERVGVK